MSKIEITAELLAELKDKAEVQALREARAMWDQVEAEADWLAEKIVTDFAWTPHHCRLRDCLDCKYDGECKNYWREAARKAVEEQCSSQTSFSKRIGMTL